jgi:hypothetical protein
MTDQTNNNEMYAIVKTAIFRVLFFIEIPLNMLCLCGLFVSGLNLVSLMNL